ncbi:MAG: hypothetical protein E7357_07435 [Clostridiales bacterium]|nr:hypothetical protein [Clostridiales bacterium]
MELLEKSIDFILPLFGGNTVLTIAFFLAVCGLLLAAVLGFALHAVSVYGSIAAIILGSFWLVGKFARVPMGLTGTCLAVLAVFGGFVYLVVYTAVCACKAVKKRRVERAEIEKRLQYTLPDRDNSFVRARLNTVLRVDEPPVIERTEKTEDVLSLSHAQKLLARLREMPLSTADRLETEEMSRLIGAYTQKDALTAGEMRTVNDTFAYLLKLSAKYSL